MRRAKTWSFHPVLRLTWVWSGYLGVVGLTWVWSGWVWVVLCTSLKVGGQKCTASQNTGDDLAAIESASCVLAAHCAMDLCLANGLDI